jgi:tetratricopeptide (TPR) repeat protein
MKNHRCAPLLEDFYRQYLQDQDADGLVERVSGRYEIGTLERLAAHGNPLARRGAVLVLGMIGDFRSNAVLGRALADEDPEVRGLAENGIRWLWCRDGADGERKRLSNIIRCNSSQKYQQAARLATQLLASSPELAEAWNQRAVAHFGLGQFDQSIGDCRKTLGLNPYHFAAATGMGQCYLQLGNRQAALDSFRLALRLNPGLEGVRAHVLHLQRTLNTQD